jgi:hypothetical protein
MRQTVRACTLLAAFFLLSLSTAAVAQKETTDEADAVAKRADIYCTGFIAETAPRTDLQVVGGEKENTKNTFAQGDVVFLNQGRESGIQPGAAYYIIRPLGEIKHPFTKKKLGYYVRELGLLRVLEVQDKTATAEITISCDTVELGDALKPYQEYSAPGSRDARPLARYAPEGSGGTTGQIVLSRGFREYLSANQIVYIDLGNRQGVHAGDYFTIYRQTGPREGLTRVPEDKIVLEHSSGYGSDRYRGGDFSVQGTHVPRSEVMKNRPQIPRKVLGELIVLKVENTSSVALITRTTAEVNIGDYVERSN